ncbi:MAG TPA: bifunctional phosphoglucose/phosphomannose isomerase [Bacteroidota bacterium]|nr:bifunctional phosphoglucose/phosphomannose isomerase [Bacteroidota bacterium]
MTLDDIRSIDPHGMYGLLTSFPAQVREAVQIGNAARTGVSSRGIRNIVLSGLGGSAIGGDILRTYLAGDLHVPFIVNRMYTLPAFVGPGSLVIISSYSGNTEETNAAHREALKRKAKVLCITSGGKTAKLAGRGPVIRVPGGLPPRAALGYSFFPLLIALARAGFITDRGKAIRETIALLEDRAPVYAEPDAARNPALQLAGKLCGRIGIVYSAAERFDSINTRWRGQIAENGKSLAFGHVIPEMNHNELVGWEVLREPMREMQVFMLRDRDDHRRVRIRMDVTKLVLGEHTERITEVWSEGSSLLARMFSLVYLGDWMSFYLAVLNGVDPTPVRVIDRLKKELADA